MASCGRCHGVLNGVLNLDRWYPFHPLEFPGIEYTRFWPHNRGSRSICAPVRRLTDDSHLESAAAMANSKTRRKKSESPTMAEKADDYLRFLLGRAVPEYSGTPGNCGAYVLRRFSGVSTSTSAWEPPWVSR